MFLKFFRKESMIQVGAFSISNHSRLKWKRWFPGASSGVVRREALVVGMYHLCSEGIKYDRSLL